MKPSRCAALVLLRSRRRFIAFEGMVPGGAYLPLTCFCYKNHPANTPFGYSPISLPSATLFKEPSCGTSSSSECHSEGGRMTVYRIRFKEQLDQRWSAWLSGREEIHEANGERVFIGDVAARARC